MGDLAQYLQETFTIYLSLVIIGAGFLGLFLGWLIGRFWNSKSLKMDPLGVAAPDSSAELNWRHEKLVLLERQEVERELRLEQFLKRIVTSHGLTETEVRARFFALSEGLRTMRSRVGSDLSRLSFASRRLVQLRSGGAPRPEAVDACLEMAGRQVACLRELRELLRPVSEKVLEMEREFEKRQFFLAEHRASFIEQLQAISQELEDSNANLSVLANETDRAMRNLLGSGQEEIFRPIREILLVDGSNTGSLSRSPSESLNDELSGLIKALRGFEGASDIEHGADIIEIAKEAEPAKPDEVLVEVPKKEDSGPKDSITLGSQLFSGLINTEILPLKHGPEAKIGWKDLDAADSGEEEQRTLVIFRSNNAELWGQDVYQGINCRARAISALPTWAQWISIQRLDTGERVFSRIDPEMYDHGGNGGAVGFNASNELFYGARHLGIFSDFCPNEIETRFTYGGWGFGHRASDSGENLESAQASGWEGKEISPDTVFEISLFADLPKLAEKDQLLEN